MNMLLKKMLQATSVAFVLSPLSVAFSTTFEEDSIFHLVPTTSSDSLTEFEKFDLQQQAVERVTNCMNRDKKISDFNESITRINIKLDKNLKSKTQYESLFTHINVFKKFIEKRGNLTDLEQIAEKIIRKRLITVLETHKENLNGSKDVYEQTVKSIELYEKYLTSEDTNTVPFSTFAYFDVKFKYKWMGNGTHNEKFSGIFTEREKSLLYVEAIGNLFQLETETDDGAVSIAMDRLSKKIDSLETNQLKLEKKREKKQQKLERTLEKQRKIEAFYNAITPQA